MSEPSAISSQGTIAGGGESGALLRSIDWAATPLGPVAQWPVTLRTTIDIMLSSRFPMRVLWGPQLVMLHNDAYVPLLGPDRFPQAMGRPIVDSFPEVWPLVGPMFARVMAGETVALDDGALPLVRSGYLEECYFTLSYSPVRDDEGSIGGLLGVVAETTSRVLAERRLETLRRLATGVSAARTGHDVCRAAADVFRGSPDVPFSLFYLRTADGSGFELVASAGLEDGAARDDDTLARLRAPDTWPLGAAGNAAGRRVDDLEARFGEVRAGPFPEPLRSALVLPLVALGGVATSGFLVVGVNPRRRLEPDYETFFELVREHVAGALGNALALAAALADRSFLESVVNQIPYGIAIYEAPTGKTLLANASAEAIYGHPSIPTASIADLGLYHTVQPGGGRVPVPDLPVVRALSGELVIEEELLFERPDGARRILLVSASPVYDPQRRRIAAVSAFVDITDRKRMEEALREARNVAETASREKDEFLAVVSHELRNPLNAMLGWTRLLRAGGLGTERASRALETIERNATNQAQLIEDLLDVSRVVAGKLTLDVRTVTLARIVEAALESAAPAIDAKGLRLRVVLDSDATLSGDPARLQQVVWNLLTNATKFTPRGGSIRVVLRRDESHVELSVTDSGQGIEPAFLGHVFDRFKQADASSTRQHGGLGLGLAIAKNLVEMHGGTIEARSDGAGKGASFVVRMPVAAMRRSPVPSPPAERPPSGLAAVVAPAELRGLRALVVDDEPDAREIMAAVLADCGVAVRTASSVAEARSEIAAEAPDLLLSDIGMPVEDGYSLIAHVRALPRDRGGAMPAACLTGYTTSDDRRRALMAGFNMHLAKPVEPNELIAVVANLGRMARALRGGA